MNPPELPAIRKQRLHLLVLSLWNGGSVLGVAGISVLICLVSQLWLGVLVGGLIAVSGAMELWGRKLVQNSDGRARFWLPFSQIWLLLVMVVYCLWSLNHSDVEKLIPKLMPDLGDLAADYDLVALTKQIVTVVYGSVILVSCLYQGGMAWFYAKATQALLPK